jgi:hypothetical protein
MYCRQFLNSSCTTDMYKDGMKTPEFETEKKDSVTVTYIIARVSPVKM